MHNMARFPLILSFIFLFSCTPPEVTIKSKDRIYTYLNADKAPSFEAYQDVYVSAYSNLYYLDGSRKLYYTVILSLRNISFSDTLYFNRISYINSEGDLLKQYLTDSILVLRPMESLEYIVEQAERAGGAGANFVVSYGIDKGLRNKPIIEAIMSGTAGHHGFAFKTDGVEIKK